VHILLKTDVPLPTVKLLQQTAMELPKKITPDFIKEAVVEIKFVSNVAPEVLIGLFFDAFDDSWFYTNRSIQAPVIPAPSPNAVQELTVRIGTESFLYND
jgi:hypothetical protein